MDAQSYLLVRRPVLRPVHWHCHLISRGSTNEFYVAGGGVHPIANGVATAADWMSAASFISMAGIIAFMGYDGAVYLMGWTGGYVILALLRPVPAQIRSVHGARLHRHSLLFHHRPGRRGDLPDSDFVYLRSGADAWRRHRVFPVP